MGLDIIPDRINGNKILSSFFNILKRVLVVNQVPRDSSGEPETDLHELGTSTYMFDKSYIESMNVGDLGSESEISEGGDDLIFNFSGVEKGAIHSTGLNYGISSSCGAYVCSGGDKYVTNLNVTLTTRGRPILIGLIDDGTTSGSWIDTTTSNGLIIFEVDGTDIAESDVTGDTPISTIKHIHPVAAGEHTIKVVSATFSGFAINYAKLIVYEL
jgi:hypothetical protein